MIRAGARLLQGQCLAQQPFRRDMVATRLSLLDSLHDRPEIMDIWHRYRSIVNGHTMGAHSKTMNADDRLELFFSQSLDGFFFMMIDEPVVWDDSIDKRTRSRLRLRAPARDESQRRDAGAVRRDARVVSGDDASRSVSP